MPRMANFTDIVNQLRRERDQLSAAISALEGLSGGKQSSSRTGRPRRHLSAAARARIAAAQRARWAKQKAGK